MQDHMQNPWRTAAYCIVPHGMFNLLSYGRECQEHNGSTTYNKLGPPTQITN